MTVSASRRVVVALCAATVGMCASTLQQTLLATATPTIIGELGHRAGALGMFLDVQVARHEASRGRMAPLRDRQVAGRGLR